MRKKPAVRVDLLREAALTRRSPLYVWMLQNHDTFAAIVSEAVRPNWKEMADAFAAEGLKDADNKAPTPEGTRQTWWKVRKTVKARTLAAARRASQAPAQPARPVVQPPPVPTQTEPPEAKPPGGKADEQLARLKEQLSAKKGRMPQPL